jgi:hypothetical protein
MLPEPVFDVGRTLHGVGGGASLRPPDDPLLRAEYEDTEGTRRRLTHEEVLNYVNLMAAAGNETTTRLIGWTGKVLAEQPDQSREVVEDRSLVPNAIEELSRYEPPSPVQARYVTTDVGHHGRVVPEGSAVFLLNGVGEPRRAQVPRSRPLRHPPHHRSPPRLRLRHSFPSARRGAGEARGTGRARRGPGQAGGSPANDGWFRCCGAG